jgi:hypothetical protein
MKEIESEGGKEGGKGIMRTLVSRRWTWIVTALLLQPPVGYRRRGSTCSHAQLNARL